MALRCVCGENVGSILKHLAPLRQGRQFKFSQRSPDVPAGHLMRNGVDHKNVVYKTLNTLSKGRGVEKNQLSDY
uniref:Uncharacterized protein n=1 Tax=Romanomermis culicivorax TaxID=13658 RepID=A0A915K4X4_ROMCU